MKEDLNRRQPSTAINKRSKTFNFASLFMTKEHRESVALLYQFCRYLDDLADCQCEAKDSSLLLLEAIGSLNSRRSEVKEIQEFLQLAESKNFPIEYAVTLARGISQDLSLVQFETTEELLQYCYMVASTVGVMFMCAVDVEERRFALPFAIDLGIAMQLTNIARDVVEDYRLKRIYIPQTFLPARTVAAAIDNHDLVAISDLKQAINKLIGMSTLYYRSADLGIRFLPNEVKPAVLIASRCYERIGEMILNRNTLAMEKVRTSFFDKLACALSALKDLAMHPTYCRSDLLPSHEYKLHLALESIMIEGRV
ncbi:MAG: phytoene/squalene synthase family protein [Candidatus Obscuribacterales bacterium]|nr:phytoene/squalene synthase family protein [Candidatus Obscuribacterales bacterium]